MRGGTATAQAFIDSLVDFSTNVDQLPLLASAPDLQNPEIRKAVWDLTRDATPIIKHRISRYVERGPIGAMVKLTNNQVSGLRRLGSGLGHVLQTGWYAVCRSSPRGAGIDTQR